MRPDQSSTSAAAERRHAKAYANRWWAISPWISMAVGAGSERYDGYRRRHWDRIVYLHQTLSIPMKIISRHALDDPRLTEPQLRERLKQYRVRKEVYDSMKHKRSDNVDK